MTTPFTIDRALVDPRLLGAGFGDLTSWSTWLVILKAAFGLSLDATEREVFASVAGGRAPPTKRVRELWAAVSRRAGKSRVAAAVALFLATMQEHKLAAGETGYVLVLAPTADMARNVFDYVLGFIDSSPVLKREVVRRRNSNQVTELRFKNNIAVSVVPSNFRTIRGRTLVGCVLDEVSFFRDEASANPDVEVYRSVMPALVASGGMLVAISSPYRRIGLMFQKHRDFFAVDSDEVLCINGATSLFNPTIDPAEIAAASAADPEASGAEWRGEWRDDIAGFLDERLIEMALDRDRPLELPRQPGIRFCAFADPSAGRGDSFGLCIGHVEKLSKRFVVDVVRDWRAPFDPGVVVPQVCALLTEYKLKDVMGDHFGSEFVVSLFKDHGVKYIGTEKRKSVLYMEALGFFTRGLISIPDNPVLVRELRLLERKTHRSGQDTVDHPRGAHDDLANAVCGCAVHAATTAKRWAASSLHWVDGSSPDDEPITYANRWEKWREHQQQHPEIFKRVGER
jgi:hypothetical protein